MSSALVDVDTAKPHRKAELFILIATVVDGIGAGIAAPVLPQLIVNLTDKDVADGAIYSGALMAAFAAMQIIFGPVLGNLSDRFGRRPVLLVSLGTFGFNYVMMAFASHIAFLFVGQFIAGAFGATIGTACAYIADISNPKDKMKKFGAITAAYGVGVTIGPTLGGMIAPFGSRTVFLCSACIALLNVLYGIFVLPESLDRSRRRAFSVKRANPLGAIVQLRRTPSAIQLLSAYAMVQLALFSMGATWSYFTMLKFGWSAREIGFSLSLYAISTILVQGVLVRHINRWMEIKHVVYVGFWLTLIGSIGFALVPQDWMLYPFVVIFVAGSISAPTLVAHLSNLVSSDTQGELQGAVSSVAGGAAVFAPLFTTLLLKVFSNGDLPVYFPGAPYVAIALFVFSGLAMAAHGFGLEARV